MSLSPATRLAASCLALWCTSALAAPEALLMTTGPRGDGYSAVTVPVDLAEVAKALGEATVPDAAELRAEAVIGNKRTPVVCQFEPETGDEGWSATRGLVSALLPPGGAPEHVLLTWAGGPAPAAKARVEVERIGDALVVRNEHYALTHDPAKMGGLPSRIEFVKSGKTFDSYLLNDRVYDKGLGGFHPRNDPSPEITVLAEGPVYAAIRVKARYMQGERQPPSRPVAVYEFRYYAGSPVVTVKAVARQEPVFAWGEHHFLEINYPDESFTAWAGGEPWAEGTFEANEKAWQAGKWGALVDGTNVLGMMGCGALKFYDGRGGYGTYLHGPWLRWDSPERKFRASLWIGNSDDGAKAVQRAAQSVGPQAQAYVTVRPLLNALGAARQACANTAGPDGGRAAWVVDRVDQLAHEQGRLSEGLALAKQLPPMLRGAAQKNPLPWYCAEARDLYAMDDGKLLAAFDRATLELVSVYNLTTRREMLAGEPPPLWQLVIEAGERSETLSADTASAKRVFTEPPTPGGVAELSWKLGPEPAPVSVLAKARLDDGGLALSLEVDNASDTWSLTGITFPQVELRGLGASPEDDVVITSRGSGEFRRAPLLNPYQFSGRYPSGWSSMQFAAYYDPEGGLYFAAEDPYASTKDIQVETVSNRPALAMRIYWPAPDSTVPGNDWRSPRDSALRLMGGHWFDAAQLYKDWASKRARWWPEDNTRPDTPQWFKDVAMWACTGGASSECVDKVKALAEYVGVPTAFHWYSWHKIPFDVEYPHYFPTKDGMAEGVKELQTAGVRVMPYINGRLWDSANDDFKNEAVNYCTKDRKGEPYIEVYGSGAKLSPMCPFTPFWQKKVREIVMRLTGPEVGVDAVYLDQIAAARPRLCFNKEHGHPLSGGHWWTTDGYWPLLTELREQLSARHPGKALTSECNAEAYSHVLDGLLTWHFQYQDQIPLFAAVYAGKIQLFSRAYKGTDQVAHRMKAGQSLVFGEQIGWLNPSVVLDNKETGEFIREMARLRYEFRDFLATGEMIRPPLLQGDLPDVTADWAWRDKWPVTTSALQSSAWKAADGRMAFLFVNVSDDPVNCAWVFRGDAYGFGPGARFEVAKRSAKGVVQEPAVFVRPLELGPRSAAVFVVAPERA